MAKSSKKADEKAKRDAIVAQALQEISFARTFKQGKTRNWKINEDLYYGRKINQEYARANVDLGLMQSHVHTILSKIDEPLIFKFTKRKESQLTRANRLNALRSYDQYRDNWDIKDLAGKKQMLIYGRAIYSYYADAVDGEYMPHLENVDVYDFLIDPSANGIDIETAAFLGDYGVSLTRRELEQGVRDGRFLKQETETLIDGQSNATEQPQEVVNQLNRTQDQNVWTTNKEISGSDKFKFWRWGTTFEGKRYYLLLTERGATAIRVEPIEEVFPSGLWWYWTYAAFLDLTEFWTPSFCDYVREVFMAQAVSINQMLDNAEQINKPQKIIQVGAIENMAELKYRREGNIKVKKDFNAQQAIQIVQTPSINTPIQVYTLLDGIQQKSSGVTAAEQGAAPNNSGAKATIYEGNQANSGDRFGYLNKSYAFGYKRFAKLYEWGVRDNLTKRIAVDILGPDGISIEEIGRKDIFWKKDQFGVMVEASNAELQLSLEDKKMKLAFLSEKSKDPNTIQNPRKAYEMEATIVGFKEEEIRQLMDKSEFGDANLMAEAERDIELILDGKTIRSNPAATTAYKQRFVDYMVKNQENMSEGDFKRFADYVESLDDIIVKNTVRLANEMLLKQELAAMSAPPKEGEMAVPPGEGASMLPPEPMPAPGEQLPAEPINNLG